MMHTTRKAGKQVRGQEIELLEVCFQCSRGWLCFAGDAASLFWLQPVTHAISKSRKTMAQDQKAEWSKTAEEVVKKWMKE